MKFKFNYKFYGIAVVAVFVSAVLITLLRAGVDRTERPLVDQRHPYDHVMRVTAVLEFDGERIEVDDLIDCFSEYRGTPRETATLIFKVGRYRLVYDTPEGGMVVIRISRNICSAYADEWSDREKRFEVPQAWVPVISWYDNRDATQFVNAETYYSETSIKNPRGRLRVVESFSVSIPPQTEEVLAEAKLQEAARDFWLRKPSNVSSELKAGFLTELPWFIRIPREEWSRVPTFQRPRSSNSLLPPRLADWEVLKNWLDSQPSREGLLLLSRALQEQVSEDEREEISFTLRDFLIGRQGGFETIGRHGIPQKEVYLYGMYLSERSWQRARENVENIPFFDEFMPLGVQDCVLTLRTDTPGIRYHFNGDRACGRHNENVKFLGKPILNGPWSDSENRLIFDLETRDLWVKG